jgi:hypothetical protein
LCSNKKKGKHKLAQSAASNEVQIGKGVAWLKQRSCNAECGTAFPGNALKIDWLRKFYPLATIQKIKLQPSVYQ